jgi:hypothetical protein
MFLAACAKLDDNAFEDDDGDSDNSSDSLGFSKVVSCLSFS